MTIDRKFTIIAFNPVSGKEYSEEDGVFILASDPAVPKAMLAYLNACVELGADQNQITSVSLLRQRILQHQMSPSKEINIDRKFDILAIRISTGEEYTQNDGFFFCAKDKAFPAFLQAYITDSDSVYDADDDHLLGAALLLQRVTTFQVLNVTKVPDINSDEEAVRCICGETPTPVETGSNVESQVVPDELSEELNPVGSVGIGDGSGIDCEESPTSGEVPPERIEPYEGRASNRDFSSDEDVDGFHLN